MAFLPPTPHSPEILVAFNEFLQERLRQGLKETLRETAEREINRVVDEAVDALETQIHTFHDISQFRDVWDIVVRKHKEL
jgi:hypothetical protein